MLRNPLYQSGLTIFEVLIALSIFALIGLASFRILGSVVAAKNAAVRHSDTLGQVQKSLFIIERDLEQIISRDIRTESTDSLSYLQANSGDYKLEFTRSGWKNPLQLSRSSLQRVAYDIGPHPYAQDTTSIHYQDKRQYLLRHYWQELDRTQTTKFVVQPLLANVTALDIGVLNSKGSHKKWPLPSTDRNKSNQSAAGGEITMKKERPLAIEFTFNHKDFGELGRLYRVN
ncbi:MAG: general secretion pathway protein J [Oceanicoccus sp.]|jgi:general secretion pathway protein J